MNYLAHAVLAKPNLYSLTGNLLGDFCKGMPLDTLHPDIRAGLLNHRATDSFTDQHPQVRQLKTLFSPTRRRFAIGFAAGNQEHNNGTGRHTGECFSAVGRGKGRDDGCVTQFGHESPFDRRQEMGL